MEYGGITAVFNGRFLTRNYVAYEKNPDTQDLYALDGTFLLSEKRNRTFYAHYSLKQKQIMGYSSITNRGGILCVSQFH